jgi:hypothetical protein
MGSAARAAGAGERVVKRRRSAAWRARCTMRTVLIILTMAGGLTVAGCGGIEELEELIEDVEVDVDIDRRDGRDRGYYYDEYYYEDRYYDDYYRADGYYEESFLLDLFIEDDCRDCGYYDDYYEDDYYYYEDDYYYEEDSWFFDGWFDW